MNTTIKNIYDILRSKAGELGLFPVYARIAIYGSILTIFLRVYAQHFDHTEMLTIIGFVACISIVEIGWQKFKAGTRIWWQLIALLVLCFWTSYIIYEASLMREEGYRNRLLSHDIQALVRGAPASIVIADGNGMIKFINYEAMKLLGYAPQELEGKTLAILMRPERIKSYELSLQRAVSSLSKGKAEWVTTKNSYFPILAKNRDQIPVRFYIFGVRLSSDTAAEVGVNKNGKDIEFYIIIEKVEPYPYEY